MSDWADRWHTMIEEAIGYIAPSSINGKRLRPVLEQIRDFYKTDDIQHICPACAKVLNKQVMKLQSWTAQLQQALLRRFMRERKGAAP